jgi:hypothetical protein
MKIKTPKVTYKEAGVFLLLLFLNFKFISIIVIEKRSIIIDLIVYFLFILTFNYSNWTYKSLFSTFLLVGTYTAINFSSYKLNVLTPLIIIQAASGIRFTRYLWINLIITGGMLIYMYFTYGLGETWVNYSDLVDRRIRTNFGFNHPNVAALYYFCFLINLMLILSYSKWEKYIFLYLVFIIPLWLFVYNNTGSRSFLFAIFILYISYLYYFLGTIINKKNLLVATRYVFITLVITFSIVTIFFALENENFARLDKILSGRLKLYYYFLNDLTPTDFIFGSSAFKNNIIDSSYVHLLFEGGIVYFLIFSWFYILSTFQMTIQRAWIPICVIFSFMAYGLMESFLLYSMLIGINIYWVTLYFYYKKGKMAL